MAISDYKLCDVCGAKAFYDSRLNYCDGSEDGSAPYRKVGNEQYSDEQINDKYGVRLDRLGDWAVLCQECAKTHRTQIVPIGGE